MRNTWCDISTGQSFEYVEFGYWESGYVVGQYSLLTQPSVLYNQLTQPSASYTELNQPPLIEDGTCDE